MGVFEYKIIDSLNSDIPDEKELKTKLLLELKKNPNPDINACERFVKSIREHEAVVNSRGYKEDVGDVTIKSVKPEGAAAEQQRPPHKVCGKSHGREDVSTSAEDVESRTRKRIAIFCILASVHHRGERHQRKMEDLEEDKDLELTEMT